MIKKIVFFAVSTSVFSSLAHANLNGNCYVDAGRKYNIDPTLIYSIAEQESSHNPSAVNTSNSNGTSDLGIMQINTFWLPTLAKHGASKNDLFDACYNIHFGTWVLAQSFSKWGYSHQAIGAYNAGFGKSANRVRLRKEYADKIQKKYQKNCGIYGCSRNFQYDARMYD